MTARAGDALAAAATAAANSPPFDDSCARGGLEEGGRCRPGGLKIRFTPDNAVGRAWGALGATPWPDDLLEVRVLARQLRVGRVTERIAIKNRLTLACRRAQCTACAGCVASYDMVRS